MSFIRTAVTLVVLTDLSLAPTAQRAPGQPSLPDNPCDIVARAAIQSAGNLLVTDVRRAPSITKIVQAQRNNADPGRGTICVFETTSAFGAISVAVLPKTERRAARYWETRNRYFQTFPGSAHVISAMGEDAWLAGGADLHVLLHDDEYLTISVQYYQPRARDC